ncbi:MAG TPA: hypothetical protein VHC93_27275, partial [Methylomirabilota bacterium]|nr:hypothetical protein [Methylomirabilota bacterium]
MIGEVVVRRPGQDPSNATGAKGNVSKIPDHESMTLRGAPYSRPRRARDREGAIQTDTSGPEISEQMVGSYRLLEQIRLQPDTTPGRRPPSLQEAHI